ncbi:hypothetical protein AVEN_102193-1 [Araneus ventricosus]|uniref:Uncharacterized protein n=1 Tax=Araneus ventricosus TaxID=182803 RepID=A0A4Y2QJJ2_ARAVE|nr:hypothetical protein AVEN_102193-1 [Araneus ventricosus]
MAGKRVCQRFLLEAKPIKPVLGDFGGKMTFLENARIMTYLYYARRYGEPSREFIVTSCPFRKAINTELFRRVNQSLFGILPAVQAGELIDSKH